MATRKRGRPSASSSSSSAAAAVTKKSKRATTAAAVVATNSDDDDDKVDSVTKSTVKSDRDDDDEEYALAMAKRTELQSSYDRHVEQLRRSCARRPQDNTALLASHAIAATVIFTHQQRGTGVCIAETGIILTCAHVLEDEDVGTIKHVLFLDGTLCRAKCIAKDTKRDCAALQVIEQLSSAFDNPSHWSPSSSLATSKSTKGRTTTAKKKAETKTKPKSKSDEKKDGYGATTKYPYVQLASLSMITGPVICIGNPGIGGMERLRGPTAHPLIQFSHGSLLGGVTDRTDMNDNQPLGWLKHDCYTYWGSSGGPLLAITPAPTTTTSTTLVDDDKAATASSSSSSATNGDDDSKIKKSKSKANKSSSSPSSSNDAAAAVAMNVTLVGMHNSRDGYHGCDIGDATTRHAVPVAAIHAFIEQHRLLSL